MVLLFTACSSGGSDTTHYNLTINVEGQGKVTPDSGSYAENEEIELKAEADKNWVFKEWQGTGIDSIENPYPLVMDANYTINAVFEEASQSSLTGEVRISNRTAESIISPAKTQQMKLKANSELKAKSRINTASNEQKQYEEREIIIKYKATAKLESLEKLEEENSLKQISKLSSKAGKVIHYQLPKGYSVQKAVEKYRRLSEVEYAQPNYIYQIAEVPNDPNYENNYQWSPSALNLEAAWDQQTGSSKEITVAVIDTGIIPNHPDLQGRISDAGYDFADGDDEPYDLVSPHDEYTGYDYSHGTHVAGIIGAIGNNGIGVTGTNWNINIVAIRVLGPNGNGSINNIAKGVKFAAGLAVENGQGEEITISEEVDVINLSLGGQIEDNSSTDQLMKNVVKEATDKGILVFAASGNGGTDNIGDNEIFEPASYEDTIAVGAVNSENVRSYFSNFGSALDLVAPGGGSTFGVYNTTGYYDSNNNEFVPTYDFMQGTSMATPYVSGVASLLLADGVSPNEVEERLKETAVDLGEAGKDEEYGYGLVDAYGALLNKKLDPPKVFAATKNGDRLTVVSEVREFANNTTYGLNNIAVDEEDIHIIGWRDVNDNGRVDEGDYYGQVGPLTVTNSSQINNLYLNYMGRETSEIPLEVEGLD